MFNERKAAQVAAFLLHKAGGKLPVLKLMKLMYLAERLSFQRYGDGITDDALVSMKHGPALSMTLNHMHDDAESCENGWDSWVSDRSDHEVALKDESMVRSPEQDLLALSESDLECLSETWTTFGHWDKYKLRNYTHAGHCPEWEDPGTSSRPIRVGRVLKEVGHSPEAVEALTARHHFQKYVSLMLD